MIRDQWIDQNRRIELEAMVKSLYSLVGIPQPLVGMPQNSCFQPISPWISIKDKLHPDKPGMRRYEHVACLVVRKREILIRQWNCEHLVWDSEDGDDFFCKAEDITHWMPLSNLPLPEESSEIENEK